MVKHLYRSWAFLHCHKYTENGGIFVCITSYLQLAGGGKRQANSLGTSHTMGFMAPRIQSPMNPFGGRDGRGGGRDGGEGDSAMRDREIVGKTVKITSGPYKGLYRNRYYILYKSK